MIDTRRTPHRTLAFADHTAILTEVDRLAQAERDGRLVRHGNWTLGQALNHLGSWIEYAYTGPPNKLPWFMPIIGRYVLKRCFFAGPMPRGVHIPRVKNGTHATSDMPLDQAVAKYRAAWTRLVEQTPSTPNALLGPLTRDEWLTLHRRHADLHLGYFDVK